MPGRLKKDPRIRYALSASYLMFRFAYISSRLTQFRHSSIPDFNASSHRGGYNIGERGQMPSTSGDWRTHNGNRNSSAPITNSGLFAVNDEPRSIVNNELRSTINDEIWRTHNGNRNSSTPITNSGLFAVNDEPRSIVNNELRSIINDELRSIINDELRSIVNGELRSVANDEPQSPPPPSYRTLPSLRGIRGSNRRVASMTDRLSDVVEEQQSDTQQSDRSASHFGARKLRRNATTPGGPRGG
jgi:hypothetical protein